MLMFAQSQLPCCPPYTVDCPSFTFPWTWLSSSYSFCLCLSSPCISSCLFCHLQGLFPTLSPPLPGAMSRPASWRQHIRVTCGVWRSSHRSPFTFCVSALPLGNTALNERGLGTGMTSSWERMRLWASKIVLKLKTKKGKLKQQPLTTLNTHHSWPICQISLSVKSSLTSSSGPPVESMLVFDRPLSIYLVMHSTHFIYSYWICHLISSHDSKSPREHLSFYLLPHYICESYQSSLYSWSSINVHKFH